jgi:hypothetical protein
MICESTFFKVGAPRFWQHLQRKGTIVVCSTPLPHIEQINRLDGNSIRVRLHKPHTIAGLYCALNLDSKIGAYTTARQAASDNIFAVKPDG